MGAKVLFKHGLKSAYNAMPKHLSNVLYFCIDTREIFKGDDLFACGTFGDDLEDALAEMTAALDMKQDELEFDVSPLQDSDNPVTSNGIRLALDEMRRDYMDRFEALNYKPIAISSMTISPSVVEKGSPKVSELSVSWSFNKKPASLSINDVSVAPSASGTYILEDVEKVVVTASDAGAPGISPTTVSKALSVSRYDAVYYGASALPSEIASSFILDLPGYVLTSSRSRTITVNAQSGQYIWYALPVSMGTPSFKVGGFEGGFRLVATLNHTNSSGYSGNYNVYRSDNSSLGNTAVIVS